MTLTQGAVPQIPTPYETTVTPLARQSGGYAVMLLYRDAGDAQKACAQIARLFQPEQP